jgi:N-methylhydantoinase A
MKTNSVRIGVDIGGTFTDLVLLDAENRTWCAKLASTPAEPERAVIDGVVDLLQDAGVGSEAVSEVIHGTTVGSNTLVQQTGADTGLITTEGFRDVLEIGRLRTPGMFNLNWDKPAPLIRRRLRLEVPERINADGRIVTPLDEAEVVATGQALVDMGISSLAVCFINSFRNPVHERRVGDLLRERFPDLAISLSVDVLAEMKEYERTSTVVVNAYVLPLMSAYITRLERGLRDIGIDAPLLISNSNGGLAAAATARSKPVFFISSGRSAGVVGAGHLGAAIGREDLVIFDMGGTTASASLVHGGEISRLQEYEFREGASTSSRFIKAGGYLRRVPTVDVAEVGSGAGSIAHIDGGGMLSVGPVSAGADPGPACYGTGGTAPTVTDANFLLGYLPSILAGGGIELRKREAERAIRDEIGDPLDMHVIAAAAGIRAIVNANMGRIIKAVTVEKGVDPRNFSLLAFGGSGPVHACDLARDIGIREVIFPRMPGVFTAMGMLASDVERYFVRPFPGLLHDLNVGAARQLIADMKVGASAALIEEGIASVDAEIECQIDLRFAGQDSQLPIPLPVELSDHASECLREDFLDAYRAVYQYASADAVETVNIRMIARGVRHGRLDFADLDVTVVPWRTNTNKRAVYFSGGKEATPTPVIDRQSFSRPQIGPLILESLDSTIVIAPEWQARVDECGNVVATWQGV